MYTRLRRTVPTAPQTSYCHQVPVPVPTAADYRGVPSMVVVVVEVTVPLQPRFLPFCAAGGSSDLQKAFTSDLLSPT